MTDAIKIIPLDGGLDFRTPPLIAQTGTLIDTLNYEMTTDIGYRRIDGVERRDGYPNGDVSKFYKMIVSVNGGTGNINDVDPGSIITESIEPFRRIGVVVDTVPADNEIRYVPFDNIITPQNGDGLVIFIYQFDYSPTLTDIEVVGTIVDGRDPSVSADPTTYYENVRAYSDVLRQQVVDSDTRIAGLTYSRDRSYEVRDAYFVEAPFLATPPGEGAVVRFRGQWWYFLGAGVDPPFVDTMWYLAPTGLTSGIVSDDFVDSNGVTNYGSSGSALRTDPSQVGYLVWLHNSFTTPGGTPTRGPVTLRPGIRFNFTVGSSALADGPLITGLPDSTEYLLYEAGTSNERGTFHLAQVQQTGGSWGSSTATGWMQGYYTVGPNFGGATQAIAVGDELYLGIKGSGGVKIAEITNSASFHQAELAGTGALLTADTRYQFGSYNFYGYPGMRRLYGVSGAQKGFWADTAGYGNVYTRDSPTDELDTPKYLNFHAGTKLGFGFEAGSYQMSVGGEPLNFSGLEGALEVATGDDITGVLSSYNDSTVVFGKRSIKRVTGTDDATLAVETISSSAGAFDYTAVNVGTTAVFTGPTGVSTLEQTDAYGDFVGQRATNAIHNWLVPRLVVKQGGIEGAGVICALPVRAKNQYRLFLGTGDCVSVHFGDNGPRPMLGRYSLTGEAVRVPFAWSSEMADNGNEVIEVVWDEDFASINAKVDEELPNPRRAYDVDAGWGFDGLYFENHADLVWTFLEGGATNVTINQVRMHGYGYGLATLDVKSAGLEVDYNQPYHEQIQDISMPITPAYLYDELSPVTSIIDQGNWGLAIKLRINGTNPEGSALTEPPHICQALQVYYDIGAGDR